MDVVALGESMVTFLPSRPGRLADVPSFDRGIGGAESNVACALAARRALACGGSAGSAPTASATIWSRRSAAYGVDVSPSGAIRDRPTGIYFRTAGDRATDAHEVALLPGRFRGVRDVAAT